MTALIQTGARAPLPVAKSLYRRAASYVDHILRGVKIADLPVQFPTKYELDVNVKTAKARDLFRMQPGAFCHSEEPGRSRVRGDRMKRREFITTINQGEVEWVGVTYPVILQSPHCPLC
jgi:hypothetical protein